LCRSHYVQAYRSIHRKGEDWHLDECECGFIYCRDPRAETKDPLTPTPPRPRHFQIAGLLTALLPAGAHVAEIGAGSGALARLLRTRFDYRGFEPGGGNAALNISEAFFTPDRPVDAIVLDNVIEHVLDPVGLLEQSASALTDGGVAVVVVPNRRDLRRFHPGWRRARHWIPPDHINYFGLSDLGRIFGQLGLQIRPFGMTALRLPRDLRYVPRAVAEHAGLSLFGHNVVGIRRVSHASRSSVRSHSGPVQ